MKKLLLTLLTLVASAAFSASSAPPKTYVATGVPPAGFGLYAGSGTGAMIGKPYATFDACVKAAPLVKVASFTCKAVGAVSVKVGVPPPVVVPPVVPITVNTPPAGYTICAAEDAICVFPRPGMIVYGALKSFTPATHRIADTGCNNITFGDPILGTAKSCYQLLDPDESSPLPPPGVIPPPVTTMPDMPIHGGLDVDLTTIPERGVGSSEMRVMNTDEVVPPSDIGAFRTTCDYSHFSFDDPIVYPNKFGVAHGHYFFGNTLTDANSTTESLMTTGNGTCRGGIANRTAYWTPALADFPGGDFTGKGKLLKPTWLSVYYKTGYTGVQPADVHVIPPGLKIIAGDPMATAIVEWGPARWSCDVVNADGTDGSSGAVGSIPPNCKPGGDLVGNVNFPQCWDGVNLDSPNHKDHMAYSDEWAYRTQAQADKQLADGGGPLASWQKIVPVAGCPATHPVPLPAISTALHYVTPPSGSANLALLSDGYKKMHPEIGSGYSLHYDYDFAWMPDIIKAWTVNCDQARKDCHSHLLGDGRMIY